MRLAPLALIIVLALSAPTLACRDTRTPTAPTVPPGPATSMPAPTPTATGSALPGTATADTATPIPAEPVASTAAIATEALPRVVFERADRSTVTLPVEVPPRAEYSVGLSGRDSLDGRGMLFSYPRGEGNAGFWMSRTHIDLAIAFVTTGGVISEIHEMTAESLEITRPAEPYEFAVEAPSGWFVTHAVSPGDTMRLDFDLSDYLD